MRLARLTTSSAALILWSAAALAQDAPTELTDVYLSVDGIAVSVPVELAAEACSLDEAAVRATAVELLEESDLDSAGEQASGTGTGEASAEMDGEMPSAEAAPESDAGTHTVTTAQGTADPTTAEPGDEMLPLAVCEIDVVRAAELGVPQANEIVTD